MGECTPILPKALAHSPNFQKLKIKKLKKFNSLATTGGHLDKARLPLFF
jgi:hypothetical protein